MLVIQTCTEVFLNVKAFIEAALHFINTQVPKMAAQSDDKTANMTNWVWLWSNPKTPGAVIDLYKYVYLQKEVDGTRGMSRQQLLQMPGKIWMPNQYKCIANMKA